MITPSFPTIHFTDNEGIAFSWQRVRSLKVLVVDVTGDKAIWLWDHLHGLAPRTIILRLPAPLASFSVDTAEHIVIGRLFDVRSVGNAVHIEIAADLAETTEVYTYGVD